MPIKTRRPIADHERVQVPAPKPVVSDGVLHGFKNPKQAAVVLYADTPPKEIPLGDAAVLLRTYDNNENVDVVYRNRIRSRMSAVRAFCMFCVGGSSKQVKNCIRTECPLWPFRTGKNPLR